MTQEKLRLLELQSENTRHTGLVAALTRENADLRAGRQPDQVLEGPAGLRLHLAARQVRVGETAVTLTPAEFDTLRTLLERRGEVVSPDVLAVTADAPRTRQVAETHVSREGLVWPWAAETGPGNALLTLKATGNECAVRLEQRFTMRLTHGRPSWGHWHSCDSRSPQ